MIDTLDELNRVIDALPAPGRGGRIGRLNAGAYTLAHLAFTAEFLLNFTTGTEVDPWPMQHGGPGSDPEQPPPFDEAKNALDRVHARLRAYLATVDDEENARLPDGLPEGWAGATVEYLLSTVAAHALVHVGELSALASLVGAPDLGLPGSMPAVRGSAE